MITIYSFSNFTHLKMLNFQNLFKKMTWTPIDCYHIPNFLIYHKKIKKFFKKYSIKMYENKCVCGKSYPKNNCAHFLSNWMIEEKGISAVKNPSGIECCSAGRPIRAKEMAGVDIRPGVFERIGLRKHDNPPPSGGKSLG